ncbi:MAG: WYL domain-containing protein, partial [Bacteroidales bacterium]|nr:WYL domain-containing protein [Bacteroidales bacterium]
MNVLSKYAWLVDKLLIAGDKGLTKAEIDEKWVNWSHSDGLPIPRQTFTRWRNAIPDAFGVDIE